VRLPEPVVGGWDGGSRWSPKKCFEARLLVARRSEPRSRLLVRYVDLLWWPVPLKPHKARLATKPI